MSAPRIPFNEVHLTGRETAYTQEAIASRHLLGNGPFAQRATALLSQRLDGAAVLLVPSCTHALEMSVLLLGLGPGDEVILPSFTFVSTANAVVLRGATPVFVDIRPDTLNLDPAAVEAAITPRTKAIMLVHYASVACDMEAFGELSDRTGIPLVEDAAPAIGATWGGKPLGTFGSLAALSFHATKNLTCGEGGALVVNDPELLHRAEILREKGTNRSAFFRGEVDKYTWVDEGSSWMLSEVAAAFLLAQLESMDAIHARRGAIAAAYRSGLVALEDGEALVLPTVPEAAQPNAHLFHVLVRDLDARTRLLGHMREAGVQATYHYVPLHLSPMGRRYGYESGDLPVTERQADRLVRLPLFTDLTDGQVDEVLEAFRAALAAG